MLLHRLAGVVLMAGMGLGACASTPEPLKELPPASRWRLLDSTRSGLETAVAQSIRFQVMEGRISGETGCNQFSAEIKPSASGIGFGHAVATKRACVEAERNRAEQAFLRGLPEVSAARMDGEHLLLLLADGSQMRFIADPVLAE